MTRFLLPLIIVSTFLVACQENSTISDSSSKATEAEIASSTFKEDQVVAQFVKQVIQPPAAEAAPRYDEFVVDPAQGKVINLSSGSQITVPVNAFVYENGKVVQEEVTIKFREFHSAADIIRSGIPMQDWSEDEKWENMLTAGMFDIRGVTSSGEAVQIAHGQSITVDLASGVDGTYDFWYFDEETGDWLNQGNNTAKSMPASRGQIVDNSPTDRPTRPTRPVRFSKDQPALDFDVDYSEFPALADKKGVTFQFAGQLGSSTDPNQNTWIFEEEWFVANLEATEQSNVYKLFLENDEKEFTTTVQSVLSEADYNTALDEYETAMAAYQSYLSAQELRREATAAFTRQMSIRRFGIYNYDVYSRWDEPIFASVNFSTQDASSDVIIDHVYLVTTEGRMVVGYPKDDWNNFNYDATRPNMLVGLGDDLEVYTLNAAQFSQQADRQQGQSIMSFQLKPAGFPLTRTDELDVLLNGDMAAL